MHDVDRAIVDGSLTAEMLAEHSKRALLPEGHSYWCDRMRQGHSPLAAARLAARDMGSVLVSLCSVTA
jgi:hypothetical protein